jgi:hypothetical protein
VRVGIEHARRVVHAYGLEHVQHPLARLVAPEHTVQQAGLGDLAPDRCTGLSENFGSCRSSRCGLPRMLRQLAALCASKSMPSTSCGWR